MIEVSGRCTSAAIETTLRVDAPGGEQLERFGRIGGRLQVHFEPDGTKVAVRDRGVQRRVIGVGEEVEHDVERFGARGGDDVVLFAAGGEREHDREKGGEEAGLENEHKDRLTGGQEGRLTAA